MAIVQHLVAQGPFYALATFVLIWLFTSYRSWKDRIVPHHSLRRKVIGIAAIAVAVAAGTICFMTATQIALNNAVALREGTLTIGQPDVFSQPYRGFATQIGIAFVAVLFAWLFRFGVLEYRGYSPAPVPTPPQRQNAQRSSSGASAQADPTIFVLIAILGVVVFFGYQYSYSFTTNEGYAILQCELYTKARLTDPDSFKPLRSSVSIDPYENNSKMLVVLLDFTSANGFGGRVKDTMICSWTMEAGSDEWRWNGPAPGRWSFKSLSRDRF